jgi:DNA-binding NarL/FixJ family response regulator
MVRLCPARNDRPQEVSHVSDVRVLVVDDHEPFRQAVAALAAETDGFVLVGMAASGEESIEAAVRLRTDLVLMDVHLPGIDGIEATRRLRASPGGPVVLLLSTYDEDEFDAQGCGAASYIPKSGFGPDQLTDAWAAAT